MRATHTISQDYVAISAARPVRASRVKVTMEVLPHDHEFAEICLVAAGTGRHVTADGEVSISAGDVFVTLPGQVHAIHPGPGLAVWNVYYLAEWFLRDVPEYQREPQVLGLFFAQSLFGVAENQPLWQVRLSPPHRRAIVTELQEIAREGDRPQPSPLYLAACFAKVLHLVAQAVPQERAVHLPAWRSDVWQVMNRIEELLVKGGGYDRHSMAAKFPVGADRLGRVFKRHTGLTPFQYYQRRRLQLARRALLNPARSITEVAHTLGFSDSSHFGREFRREFSQTPHAFRVLFTGV